MGETLDSQEMMVRELGRENCQSTGKSTIATEHLPCLERDKVTGNHEVLLADTHDLCQGTSTDQGCVSQSLRARQGR